MSKALVLLSGGLDSTVCLFWALEQFSHVRAITFDYMQRHWKELVASVEIAKIAGVPHDVVRLEIVNKLSASALTRRGEIVDAASTVTPGRNAFFLLSAAVAASVAGIEDLVIGASFSDANDYPDCRRAFLDAMEVALTLGVAPTRIHTPLIAKTKEQTIRMAEDLGDRCWEAISTTVTCYEMNPPDGGCRKCPACRTRAAGFQDAGIVDPIMVTK